MSATTVSAYAAFCAAKNVTEVQLFVPAELGDMIRAATGTSKRVDWIRDALATAVNAAGLTRMQDVLPVDFSNTDVEDRAPVAWTYTAPVRTPANTPVANLKKAELVDANAKLEADLASIRAELAAAKAALVPTPPAIKADAKTGKLIRA